MFKFICRLAMALSEAAIALIPACAERLTPSAAARLAIIARFAWRLACAETLAETDAVACAEAEAERAAMRLAAAPGARRFTLRLKLTAAITDNNAESEDKPGTLGTGMLPNCKEFSRLISACRFSEALGAARLIPKLACI